MDDDNDQKSIFEKITDTVTNIASSAMDASKPSAQPATGERTVAATAGEGAVADPSPLSTATMRRNPKPVASKASAKKKSSKPTRPTAKSAEKKVAGKAKKSAKKTSAKKSGAKKVAAKKSAAKKATGKAKKVGKKSAKKGAKKAPKKSKKTVANGRGKKQSKR